MSLLAEIGTPHDVALLAPDRLSDLAAEVRAEIVRVTSLRGGHLASNLGTVELCIALLRAFEPPRDAVLFDVSHQAYAWKLLTGRAGAFGTLRTTGGLSGFLRRAESPYDVFGAGHAGTALSAALGIATARDLRGEPGAVVAVVGDASMANGVSLEALDNAPGAPRRLVVVLNDNGMSIGAPTGALSRALRSGGAEAAFARFGFRTAGPVDGHDVSALVAAFEEAKRAGGPVLVRVSTRKGRGFAPAERDPEPWHSTGPFDPATGRRATVPAGFVRWSDAFGAFLCEEAARDPRIFAITAGMTDGTGLSGFAKSRPERFRDVGICEAHELTFAAGLAAAGMRPVAAVYSTFFQRAWDNFVHDAALQGLPVLLALDRAGVVPGDGATHHGVFDVALLRGVPGVVVMAPRTPCEMRRMLRTALGLSGPSAVRWPRGAARDDTASDDGTALPVGRAAELSRTGERPEAAIWTLGPEDAYADAVRDALLARGIGSVRVDARFAKPVDAALLRAQADAGVRVFFTWEDGIRTGGFGDAVRDVLSGHPSRPRVVSFGWPDEFLPHASSRADLLRACGLEPAAAAAAIRNALER